jgi:hypothetical protein
MNRQEILDRLRQNERALRERGVTRAALFGSRVKPSLRPVATAHAVYAFEGVTLHPRDGA